MPVQVDVEVGVGDERALQRQGGVAGDAFHLLWVVGEGEGYRFRVMSGFGVRGQGDGLGLGVRVWG